MRLIKKHQEYKPNIHKKNIPQKSYLNTYFDKIFCINLEKRKDRRKRCDNHFKSLGINVTYIEAIDGDKINNIPPNINKGEIGCILSHIKIYEYSKNNNIGRYLILEDDCEFDKNIEDLFISFVKEVPEDWKLLYFGGNHNSKDPYLISKHIHKLENTYTTHCYAVNNGFTDILLENIKVDKENIKQIDVELSDLQKMFPCYGFIPHLAWQVDGYSDIVKDFRKYDFLKGKK